MSESITLTDAAYDEAVKYVRRFWHDDATLSAYADPGDDVFEEIVGAVIAAHIAVAHMDAPASDADGREAADE